VRYLAAP